MSLSCKCSMFALLDGGMYILICGNLCRDDCEVFFMAYAEHLVLGWPMQFKQNDMWFYRQKIVHDVYYKQWENSGFLESMIDDGGQSCWESSRGMSRPD